MAKNFWEMSHPDTALAMVDARSGDTRTFAGLRSDVRRIRAALPELGRRSLGLLLAANRQECIATYLAALQAGSALILMDAALAPELTNEVVRVYRPDWFVAGSFNCNIEGYRKVGTNPEIFESQLRDDLEIHPDLGILLSTSGSTGSPKLVRLTLKNLQANAESIAEYLQLTPDERPVTSLPMAYSYGLSVINSHMLVGASLVLSEFGVLQREFWDLVDRHSCTSMAGVPYTYQMLLKMGVLRSKGLGFKTLTQAGGRLAEEHVREVHEIAEKRGWRFFVMYGQTEATARISYVPPEDLTRKAGSVGIPIPAGSLRLDEETGELIYQGPNVMMGYAERREDLARGDELKGILKTGDLARQDEDGYFYLTGRTKRFLKLFGKRFNLDDPERMLARRFGSPIACYGQDDLLMVAVEQPGPEVELVAMILRTAYDLPAAAVEVLAVDRIPRTTNGKVDYQALKMAKVSRSTQ
jgi:acyl-CoA synthetase (AMP-forming)/AMP-acid ligase II